MALSLGVKVGDTIYASDIAMDVRAITANSISLACGDCLHEITTDRYVDVAPGVRVRRGYLPGSPHTNPKLNIEAPKHVGITLYRRDRSVNLQKRLVHLCEVVNKGHEWPWRTLQRLCQMSPKARQALKAILADPDAPRFGADWTERFKYIATSRPVAGGLPGLGRRN